MILRLLRDQLLYQTNLKGTTQNFIRSHMLIIESLLLFCYPLQYHTDTVCQPLPSKSTSLSEEHANKLCML